MSELLSQRSERVAGFSESDEPNFCFAHNNCSFYSGTKAMAEEVIELTGSSSKLVFGPLPVNDPMQRQPGISLARQKMGWEPKVQLKEGLRHTIAYFDELLSGAQ